MRILVGADGFGAELKDQLVKHLEDRGLEVEDLGVDGKYYAVAEKIGKKVAESEDGEMRGVLVCGTGMGMSIIANKFAGAYAAVCDSIDSAKNARSINNANIVTLGAKYTGADSAKEIVDTFLSTDFKAPAPANDNKAWDADISTFLDASMGEIPDIGASKASDIPTPNTADCPICFLRKDLSLQGLDIMPGGAWQILREDPTSAIVRFKAGSIEPAHHHTFGHDIYVISGRKRVENITANVTSDLATGDFLYTPATHVHRVHYFEDTEFFIKWDGHWDLFFDETREEALAAAAATLGTKSM